MPNRTHWIFTRERRMHGMADSETFGVGGRVPAAGAWGFAATRDLAHEGIALVESGKHTRATHHARSNESPVVPLDDTFTSFSDAV